MSSTVIPSLVGLGINVKRTPQWDTSIQTNTSGKEVRIANAVTPRYKWQVQYNVLRTSAAYGELQSLLGFFNKMRGQFDTFLYRDADDNAITGQVIGTGDGSTTGFQLIRTLGGFAEPILAPNAVTAVYINGVSQATGWTVSAWVTASPGVITFSAAPANGAVISVDFTYYWPCRMSADSIDYDMFLHGYYKVAQFAFISVKN